MLSLPDDLSTKELCPLLGLNESSVRRRAARECWQRIPARKASAAGTFMWRKYRAARRGP
jgi:hypothetical protein